MSVIGYVTIGALDSVAAGKFYDAVLGALGDERKTEGGGWIGYGDKATAGEGFMACHTAICPPHDGKPARAGNGIMIAYRAASPEAVRAAWRKAVRTKAAPAFALRKHRAAFMPPICAILPATSSASSASHSARLAASARQERHFRRQDGERCTSGNCDKSLERFNISLKH